MRRGRSISLLMSSPIPFNWLYIDRTHKIPLHTPKMHYGEQVRGPMTRVWEMTG